MSSDNADNASAVFDVTDTTVATEETSVVEQEASECSLTVTRKDAEGSEGILVEKITEEEEEEVVVVEELGESEGDNGRRERKQNRSRAKSRSLSPDQRRTRKLPERARSRSLSPPSRTRQRRRSFSDHGKLTSRPPIRAEKTQRRSSRSKRGGTRSSTERQKKRRPRSGQKSRSLSPEKTVRPAWEESETERPSRQKKKRQPGARHKSRSLSPEKMVRPAWEESEAESVRPAWVELKAERSGRPKQEAHSARQKSRSLSPEKSIRPAWEESETEAPSHQKQRRTPTRQKSRSLSPDESRRAALAEPEKERRRSLSGAKRRSSKSKRTKRSAGMSVTDATDGSGGQSEDRSRGVHRKTSRGTRGMSQSDKGHKRPPSRHRKTKGDRMSQSEPGYSSSSRRSAGKGSRRNPSSGKNPMDTSRSRRGGRESPMDTSHARRERERSRQAKPSVERQSSYRQLDGESHPRAKPLPSNLTSKRQEQASGAKPSQHRSNTSLNSMTSKRQEYATGGRQNHQHRSSNSLNRGSNHTLDHTALSRVGSSSHSLGIDSLPSTRTCPTTRKSWYALGAATRKQLESELADHIASNRRKEPSGSGGSVATHQRRAQQKHILHRSLSHSSSVVPVTTDSGLDDLDEQHDRSSMNMDSSTYSSKRDRSVASSRRRKPKRIHKLRSSLKADRDSMDRQKVPLLPKEDKGPSRANPRSRHKQRQHSTTGKLKALVRAGSFYGSNVISCDDDMGEDPGALSSPENLQEATQTKYKKRNVAKMALKIFKNTVLGNHKTQAIEMQRR